MNVPASAGWTQRATVYTFVPFLVARNVSFMGGLYGVIASPFPRVGEDNRVFLKTEKEQLFRNLLAVAWFMLKFPFENMP